MSSYTDSSAMLKLCHLYSTGLPVKCMGMLLHLVALIENEFSISVAHAQTVPGHRLHNVRVWRSLSMRLYT